MITILHQGLTILVEANDGDTLLNALVSAGVHIAAPCGGNGKCNKCRVELVGGAVTGEMADEFGTVRACIARVSGDATIKTLGVAAENFVKITDNNSNILRGGIALDVGTTTVIATLVDLETGEPRDKYNALNAQGIFGADVISRISAATAGKTSELNKLIISQINSIISGFCTRNNVKNIQKIAVSANTTMLHLVANVNPSSIGVLPFKPVFTQSCEYNGADLGINALSVELLPSIAGFLGGDILAGIICQNMHVEGDNALLIDMGTNGEMALASGGKLFCCSTATGPALEGAEISCGKGGTIGAIDHVKMLSGAVTYTTINNAAADGICGSGLTDAIAVMIDSGFIDESGAIEGEENFILSEKVSVTQADIRKFQLAKSAIRSGIVLLAQAAGLTVCDIKKVYITGGLGFYLDSNSAIKTGMLPSEFADKIQVCPNLSLQGALNYLLEPDFKVKCISTATKTINIELATNPAFLDEFTTNMFF